MLIRILALYLLTQSAFALTVDTMAINVTGTGNQPEIGMPGTGHPSSKTFNCVLTSTGAGSATVLIKASSDPLRQPITLMTLSPTNTTADAGTDDYSAFSAYWADVTAITGTNATVNCFRSYQ